MCTIAASIITAVAGGLWQGYTANQQAKAQASQAEANARVAEQNAQKLDEQAQQQAENNRINEENKRRQLAGRIARQQVGIAASGLSATGSALNALSDSQYEMEKELAIDRYNARQQVDNIFQASTDQTNQANMYHQQARDYKKAGKWAWINAGLQTAFSLSSTLYGAKSAAVRSVGGTVSTPAYVGYGTKATNQVAQGQGLTWNGFTSNLDSYRTSYGVYEDSRRTVFGKDPLRF
ncbi:MAG: hypothetical protein IJ056_10515 [Acidaminococcaceae bacterium]|nr:hypothetical protein [Acidaminococcaceae bacterium]